MRSILLVPSEKYREALLKGGPCGARPPVASEVPKNVETKPCPVCGSALRWSRAPTEQTDSCWVCVADWRHEFRQRDVLLYEWRAGEVGGLDYSRRALALVLTWDGVPAKFGVFRAWDLWGPDEDPEFAASGLTTYDMLAEALDSLNGCQALAEACERCGLGTVVTVEADHA